MPYPQQTFNTFDELRQYENTEWVTNGNNDITAVIGNNVVNGLLSFIEKSPLNWQKSQLISDGGVQAASRPVVVFIQSGASSFTFPDNIYNQYVFINTTASTIPLGSSQVYYDIDGVPVDYIPAKSVITIYKSNNDLWIMGQTGSTIPPSGAALRMVVGEAGAPVTGESTFQSDLLIGIAGADGRFSFQIDGVSVMSYGLNASFTIDNDTGEIDISPNVWVEDSSIEIPLIKTQS